MLYCICNLFKKEDSISSYLLAEITALVPVSEATKEIVISYINAGATVASIVALLGGNFV